MKGANNAQGRPDIGRCQGAGITVSEDGQFFCSLLRDNRRRAVCGYGPVDLYVLCMERYGFPFESKRDFRAALSRGQFFFGRLQHMC